MATTITVEGSQAGLASGVRHIGPITLTFTGAIVATSMQFSSASSISAAPPAGTTGMLVVPPLGTTTTLTLKGVSGDTGVIMAPGVPALIPLDSATTLVFTSSAAITGKVELIWL